MKALVLDNINTTASLAVARSLGIEGHLVDVACPRKTVAFASKHCRKRFISPGLSDKPRYIQFLLTILKAEQYDLLFITEDSILELVVSNRKTIEPLVNCFLPGDKALEIALSKNKSTEFCESIGVPVPTTLYPSDESDVKQMSTRVSFPKVVKGEKGTAANLIQYVSSPDELVRAYHHIQELESSYHGRPTIQDVVQGKEFLVHVLCHRGKVLRICCHEKVLRYPVDGGVTTLGITVNCPELIDTTVKIFEGLRWHGLAKLDYMQDSTDGQLKFLSIDPRVSSSIDLPRFAGINFSDLLCQLAAGNDIGTNLNYQVGTKYRWIFPREILYNFSRPSHIPVSLWQFFDSTYYSDLQLSDPYPAIMNLKHTFWNIRDHFKKGTLWSGGMKVAQ